MTQNMASTTTHDTQVLFSIGVYTIILTQDMNKLPKPPIQINLNDPFYQSSALHFNDLFHRYGLPIIVLNLIKQKEKQPRELKLNHYFMACIKYLDQFYLKVRKSNILVLICLDILRKTWM